METFFGLKMSGNLSRFKGVVVYTKLRAVITIYFDCVYFEVDTLSITVVVHSLYIVDGVIKVLFIFSVRCIRW